MPARSMLVIRHLGVARLPLVASWRVDIRNALFPGKTFVASGLAAKRSGVVNTIPAVPFPST